MQLATLRYSEKEKDIILISPTGSGKTIAFLLPVLQGLDPLCKEIQALILVPSRELAMQINSISHSISSGYKINCCYGGQPIKSEIKSLQQNPAILIGTPGRILDHIDHGRINVSSVKVLVLDEFDKCLELGFQEQMEAIIKHISGICKRILTSATEGEIPEFTGLKTPEKIYFEKKESDKRLSLYSVISPEPDKLKSLETLLRNLSPGKVPKGSVVFYQSNISLTKFFTVEWNKPEEKKPYVDSKTAVQTYSYRQIWLREDWIFRK